MVIQLDQSASNGPIGINPMMWARVCNEVKKTKGNLTWYETDVYFVNGDKITVLGRLDWVLACLSGVDASATPKGLK
jgi:hypothetical protein